MPFHGGQVALTEQELEELKQVSVSRTLSADDVFRARLILMLAEGRSYAEIQRRLDTTAPTVSRWKRRFAEHGITGLMGERRIGQKPTVITPELRDQVVAASCRKPADGSARWSCRKLANELGISKDVVHRIWRMEGLRPHRLERYGSPGGPDFESEAVDIIALYIAPPQHAAVFYAGAKADIRALDGANSGPRQAPAAGARHGCVTVYESLSAKSRGAGGKAPAPPPNSGLVSFLTQAAGRNSELQKIHIILHRVARHDTDNLERFLHDYTSVVLHLTPTYSSWLNRVGEWCSRIGAQGGNEKAATPVMDLSRKLVRQIRAYSKAKRCAYWIDTAPGR